MASPSIKSAGTTTSQRKTSETLGAHPGELLTQVPLSAMIGSVTPEEGNEANYLPYLVQYTGEAPPRSVGSRNTQGDGAPERENLGIPSGIEAGQSPAARCGTTQPTPEVPSHDSRGPRSGGE